MKTLHLLRHAKASFGSPFLSDIQRPLDERGKKDAQLMALAIHQSNCLFSTVCVSSAIRACSTIEQIQIVLADKLDIKIHVTKDLYTFDYEELLDWLYQQNDVLDELFLVGHNPALSELVSFLTGSTMERLPTCGYVRLCGQVDYWEDCSYESMQLKLRLTPTEARLSFL